MLENIKLNYIQNSNLLQKLPVFYQPWYMDIFGIEWDVVVAKNENYTLVFPYFIEKKLGFTLSRPHHLTPYYGPYLLSENNTPPQMLLSDWEKIKQQMPRWSMQWLTPHYSFDTNYLLNDNFKKVNKVTYVLDLNKSTETLFNELDPMRRRNIRKAEKELTIQANDFDIDRYIDWMQQTFKKRNNKFYYDKNTFRNYLKEVMAHNAALAYTCNDKNGNAVAMTLTLFDAKCGYAILVAKNPEITHSAATTALLWQSILQCKQNNCSVFDFEGSSIPEIANFYAKFGSTKIAFNSYQKINSLLWKIKESWS